MNSSLVGHQDQRSRCNLLPAWLRDNKVLYKADSCSWRALEFGSEIKTTLTTKVNNASRRVVMSGTARSSIVFLNLEVLRIASREIFRDPEGRRCPPRSGSSQVNTLARSRLFVSLNLFVFKGASSGFGRSLISSVLARGDRVIATSRSLEPIQNLEGTNDNLRLLQLDVTAGEDLLRYTSRYYLWEQR
jgi:hypothetical protein